MVIIIDVVGIDDDDDEHIAASGHKRKGKDSGMSQRKLEKEEPGAKSKKAAKVLVEVRHLESQVFPLFFM